MVALKSALEGVGKGLQFLTASKWFWYAIIALIAWIGYKRLTKPKEETFLEMELPNSGTGLPKGWNANPLVEELHSFYGDSWFSAFLGDPWELKDTYIRMLTLTNDQFQLVVQTYNAKYAKKGGTLWSRVTSATGSLFIIGSQDKQVQQRMIALKLNY